MSGVLNAMVGQGGGSRFSVTLANFLTDNYGYNQPNTFGAISPSAFSGASIINVSHDSGSGAFSVTLDGVLAQSFFRGIEIQTTSGSTVTLYTSDAIYSTISWTFWSWTGQTVWTSTSPATRLIRIF
jgi:hypothetical protein